VPPQPRRVNLFKSIAAARRQSSPQRRCFLFAIYRILVEGPDGVATGGSLVHVGYIFQV